MIRPEEIDPTIQANLKARLDQIFTQNAVLDPAAAKIKTAGLQAWKEASKRYAARYWGAAALWCGAIFSMPILAQSSEGLALLGFLAFNAAAGALLVGGVKKTKADLARHVSPHLMRQASKLVDLNRAEQLYCEAVAGLIDSGATLGEASQKELLRQLNELLAGHRALDIPLQRYLAGGGSASVEVLEQEAAELTRRRDAQEDPTARSTMEQSLALCVGRLEHARRVEPAREQVAAQQELILQTMASVHAGLARICAAGSTPAGVNVHDLQESVAGVTRQARAVEEAVTEVIALGA